MKTKISETFKTNSKPVKGNKVNKQETLIKLGITPNTVQPAKTHIMINGVPCNPLTKEPFKSVK